MRERLPSSFRLGNKGLSGQLALLNHGAGDSIGSGESRGAELLGSSCPAQVSGKIQGGTLLAQGMLPPFHAFIS